ncbi:MAG TPA: hypothetical protein VJR92_04080 [Gemmatimonadaceae bacterium]|nr:hypothetical protein [Gemmatimonadaceae bacterium]
MDRARASGALVSIAVLQVLTILVGIVRSKGLAQVLGLAGFGVAGALDQAILTAVTFGAFALPYTAMKFMARSHSESEAEFRHTGAGFLRLLLVMAIVTASIAYAVFTWFPALLGDDLAIYNRELRIAAIGIVPAMLLLLFVNTFAAAQKPGTGAAVNLVYLAGAAIASILGGYVYGLTGLYVASVATAIVLTFAGLAYLQRTLGINLTDAHSGVIKQLRSDPRILGYAACFYATLLGYMLTLLVARTVVLAQVGAEAAGHLQAAFSIALAFGAVFTSLNNLYLAPLVNRRADVADKVATTSDFTGHVLVLLLLGVLPIVLFPGVFLQTLFSADFVPMASVLWWFALWQCITLIGNAYQQLLVGLDDVVYIAVAAIVSYGSMLVAMPPLAQVYGLAGIGIALCGGVVLHFTLLVLRVRLKHGGRIPARVSIRLAGLVAVVVSAHFVFAGRHEIGVAPIAARVGFAALALLVGWFALDKQERDPRGLIASLRGNAGPATGP